MCCFEFDWTTFIRYTNTLVRQNIIKEGHKGMDFTMMVIAMIRRISRLTRQPTMIYIEDLGMGLPMFRNVIRSDKISFKIRQAGRRGK